MKTIPILCVVPIALHAQAFDHGVSIHSGSGEDQKSKAYQQSGPYVIQWTLNDLPPSKRDDPYWKPTTPEEWKRQWLALSVHEAATGKRICGGVISGRDNWLNVPQGGSHYVVVSAWRTIQWSIRVKSGQMGVTDKGPVLTNNPPPSPGMNSSSSIHALVDSIVPREPAPDPKPSSVPGLPAGVEPANKKQAVLPPGMTKGGKP